MVRAARKSAGDRAAATASGAPAPSVAFVCQLNKKPPVTLQVSPSSGLATPESVASAERALELPAKLVVKATRSEHVAQPRPSPAMPVGQAPQVDALAQDTPV